MRNGLRELRSFFRGLDQIKRNQALLARRIAALEAGQPGSGRQSVSGDGRFPDGISSRMCNQRDLAEPWFHRWCEALGTPTVANRKLWEFAFIANALDVLGMLREGTRGLGFGVGREPLVALFAARGCSIIATDQARDRPAARLWSDVDQYAGGLEDLIHEDLCDPERFRKRVNWKPVDMNAIPANLAGFDFCWSACALEHLGTLSAGLDFVEASLCSLRPGGIAVHTTELNVGSPEETIAKGPTVLYRPRDLQGLVANLEGAGHQVARLDLDPGTGLFDEYVDVPPYVDEPHLRLRVGRYTTTSVGLVIRAATDGPAG